MLEEVHERLHGKYSLETIDFVYKQLFLSIGKAFKNGASSVKLRHLGSFFLSGIDIKKVIEKRKSRELDTEKWENLLELSKEYILNKNDNYI